MLINPVFHFKPSFQEVYFTNLLHIVRKETYVRGRVETMNIGFIGTGNMGRILVEALIDGRAVAPSSMIITNRTKAKAMLLKNKYKKITVGSNASEVAAHSDLLFICVKPLDVYNVLEEIKPLLNEEKCVIS